MKNGGLNNCSLLWDPLWEFSINLSKYTKSKISDFYNIMFLFGSKYLQWGSFEMLWQIFHQTSGNFKHLPKRTLKQMIHHLKIIFYDEHDCLSHFTKQNRIFQSVWVKAVEDHSFSKSYSKSLHTAKVLLVKFTMSPHSTYFLPLG